MRVLLFLSGIVSLSVSANDSFPENYDRFRQRLVDEKPLVSYALNSIHSQFPRALLDLDSLLPQSSSYPLNDLKLLYQAATKCSGPWPVSPEVTEPLLFSRAVCNQTWLPAAWFSRTDLIHPGGGSYGLRYVEIFPSRMNDLERYFHIQERQIAEPETLLGRLQRMPELAIDALNSGSEFFLSGDELWFRKGGDYYLYTREIWQPALHSLDLDISDAAENSYCLTKVGNLCWNWQETSSEWRQLVVFLAIINLFGLGGWLFNRWSVKRRLIKERMAVLQILTHELRTPIASLTMTVEGFRRKFDSLPEEFYDEFRRICEDSMRLKQLAEASKDYLQSGHKPLETNEIPSVNEWLAFVCDEHDVTLTVKEDSPVYVNMYWLKTSLDNLITNALKYGVAPVSVCAERLDGKLTISVRDHGTLSDKDWKSIRKPFVSESGLGLGLTIVDAMVKRMGGKLSFSGPPTTFVLEIPCDSVDAVAR
ncbi:DUF3404 domain-containing protein [Veronia pacifica]|uniref:histidine kinase n=1 Tax=Veronia pacifica TaxID=1080227 RepID=A0A1C3EKI7_9GAMM|nr:DUF3404 domain-containing protein [Veronia pacifica]ODA33756.1 histidine kinase [Veronia pacifica]